MSYHSGQNRRAPRISFTLGMARCDLGYIYLLGAIKDVRAAAGQEGVDKFIDEWRKRGFVECRDEDAAELKVIDLPTVTSTRRQTG